MMNSTWFGAGMITFGTIAIFLLIVIGSTVTGREPVIGLTLTDQTNKAQLSHGGLELLDEHDRRFLGSCTLVGHIRNNAGRVLTNVSVIGALYNSHGDKVADIYVPPTNLTPNQTWEFSYLCVGTPNAISFQITEIDAQ
jgi:hypothetical protein